MKRKDYEKVFRWRYLGIKNVIWLGSGIAGDDTHGHVDDITRFVAPSTIVTTDGNKSRRSQLPATTREHSPPARRHCRSGRKASRHYRTPYAAPVIFEGRRLPASYAQFLYRAWRSFVPVLQRSQRPCCSGYSWPMSFPTARSSASTPGDLIWGFGAMHCMTQQQPVVGR